MSILTAKVKVRAKPQKTKTKRRLKGIALSTCRGAIKHLRYVLNHDTRLPLRTPGISNDRLILRNDITNTNAIEDALAILEDALGSTVKIKTNR